ncbi:MAG: sugar phosphate isomerase/epimerase family protein [Kiritimatiellia bacterium]|jgi:sugar phosphate isomerase/epimerase
MHITHAIPLNGIPSSLRPFLLAEVAATGQKDIILCSSVLREMIANPNVIPEYRALLDDAGLRFCDSHAPYGRYADLNCPVAELRPVMLAQQRLAIEIAAMLGVKTLAVHVGESGFLEWSLDRLHAFFLDSLEALLPVAEQFGVVLCVENIWFPTCAPDRLLDALERFPLPFAGRLLRFGPRQHRLRTERRAREPHRPRIPPARAGARMERPRAGRFAAPRG